MTLQPAPTAWLVTLLMTAVALGVTWPLAAALTSALPGDYGDPLFVAWALGWVGGELTHALVEPTALAGLWHANIFYPETQTLALSEHFIGQTVLVLPVYWLTGNLILSYNIAFLASFVLIGLGTFLLARALTGSTAGAIVAAAIASFNEYRLIYEVAHLHVLSLHWLPFALLALHRYFATDARRYLGYAALALIALNLSSVYYMAYCAPLVAMFTACELVYWGRWRIGRVWLELWALFAVIVVATLPFVLPYIDVQQRLGITRSLDEVVRFSATFAHYRAALPGLTPGIALALVALGGALVNRNAMRRWAIATSLLLLVLSFWLSLGPTIRIGPDVTVPGLYLLLYDHVPGFTGLRVPARYAAPFFVFLALLASAGVATLEQRWPRPARVAAAVLLAVIVMRAAPRPMPLNQALVSKGLAPPPAYLQPAASLPAIYSLVDTLPANAILAEFPFGDPWYDLRYMYFAAKHRRRLLNGYSGVFPPTYLARQRVLARPLLDPERAYAALNGATHVVVHRRAWGDDSGTAISGWLQAAGWRLIAESDDAAIHERPLREQFAGGLDGVAVR